MIDANNMNYEDYLKLFCYTQLEDKNLYKKYKDFRPSLRDIQDYNHKLEQFEKAWNTDKSLVHKPISLTEQPTDEPEEDNDFDYCQQIGHKFELWVEKQCARYGVELGMYYDERQFKGENQLGLEIKHDSKLRETNNVYVEYQALSKDGSKMIAGGITKKDNSKYWLIGTEDEYYIFYKEDLVKIYERMMAGETVDGCKFAERRTSKGIAISRETCKKLMIADNIGEFLVKVGIIY